MSEPYDIILEPILTEKTTYLLENENKVTFKVKCEATKPQIISAVERLFDVDVDKVNTCIMPSQPTRVGMYIGRTQAYKKAYVSLSEDDYIDFYAMEGAGPEAGVV
ncbi:MAG: 50S ribosomal protein L23 [Bradymonadaceae bacterium]